MRKAFLQLHIAVLFAGFTAILGKLINLNEGMIVWYRMLVSAITLFIILLFQKQTLRLSLKKTCILFGVGAIIALHWVTFYGSIKYSNVSVSVTCLSAIGFFTSFLEPLITRKKIDAKEVLLGIMTIAGIYLIFNFYPEYKVGIIFGITSAMLACLFPIFNKKILKSVSPKVIALYEMSGGFLALCFILPLYFQYFPARYYLATLSDWMWLLVLAWICTVFAFILSLNALTKISAFTANLSFNLEPVYSIILAFIIFKENKFLGPGFYLGFGLILLAITLQMRRVWTDRKREKIKLVS
jgi:drug/metabolite transporter (DMT)-like permease